MEWVMLLDKQSLAKARGCNDLSVNSITHNVSLPLYMLCLYRKDFIKLMPYGKDKKLTVKNVYYL